MHYFTMEVSFYYLLLNRRQYFSSVFFFVLALATLLGEMQALKELQVHHSPAPRVLPPLATEPANAPPFPGPPLEPTTVTVPPVFQQENNTELHSQVGTTAVLHCHTEHIGENTVSWVRRRDYHLLTVALIVYSSDQRFSVRYVKNEKDWQLHIRYVQKRDEGVYECQIATHPPISLLSTLYVVEATSEILGGPEKYMTSGSSLRLVCVLRKNTQPPSYVFWYHGDRMINYDSEVKVDTGGEVSVLFLGEVRPDSSGNYTCVPSNAQASHILVHVLRGGETPAAIHSGTSSITGVIPLWITYQTAYWLTEFMTTTSLLSNHYDYNAPQNNRRCSFDLRKFVLNSESSIMSKLANKERLVSLKHEHSITIGNNEFVRDARSKTKDIILRQNYHDFIFSLSSALLLSLLLLCIHKILTEKCIHTINGNDFSAVELYQKSMEAEPRECVEKVLGKIQVNSFLRSESENTNEMKFVLIEKTNANDNCYKIAEFSPKNYQNKLRCIRTCKLKKFTS